jgi:hypothetical protein
MWWGMIWYIWWYNIISCYDIYDIWDICDAVWYDIWYDNIIWYIRYVMIYDIWNYTIYDTIHDMIYLLTAIGLTPGVSSTVHIYTQTVHKTTQSTQTIHITTQFTNVEECGPCPIFTSYTLAFALQTEKKAQKTLSQGSRKMPGSKGCYYFS